VVELPLATDLPGAVIVGVQIGVVHKAARKILERHALTSHGCLTSGVAPERNVGLLSIHATRFVAARAREAAARGKYRTRSPNCSEVFFPSRRPSETIERQPSVGMMDDIHCEAT
jgi:hypothetical protein